MSLDRKRKQAETPNSEMGLSVLMNYLCLVAPVSLLMLMPLTEIYVRSDSFHSQSQSPTETRSEDQTRNWTRSCRPRDEVTYNCVDVRLFGLLNV